MNFYQRNRGLILQMLITTWLWCIVIVLKETVPFIAALIVVRSISIAVGTVIDEEMDETDE